MNVSKISVPTNKGVRIIECKDILYCQADGRYTQIFTQSGENYCIARVLKTYEDILPQDYFLRIHKSYIVNLSSVKEYFLNNGWTVVLKDNTKLNVSRRRCKDFKSRVLDLFPVC